MPFELFDPDGELAIRQGNLPHWFQPGVTYFVTFRTADSVSEKVASRWHALRRDWLLRHGVDPSTSTWQASLSVLPRRTQQEFNKTFTAEFMRYLDRGHGACVLRRPEAAQIVAESLQHGDGNRYHLGDFVVMPNHVHLLCCLIGGTEIEEQCYAWKKFTAGKINRLLGGRGRFWQEESFDHLVRTAEAFEYFRHYIETNPSKATLKAGEFFYYRATH